MPGIYICDPDTDLIRLNLVYVTLIVAKSELLPTLAKTAYNIFPDCSHAVWDQLSAQKG